MFFEGDKLFDYLVCSLGDWDSPFTFGAYSLLIEIDV
jgi:hypothetical protein